MYIYIYMSQSRDLTIRAPDALHAFTHTHALPYNIARRAARQIYFIRHLVQRVARISECFTTTSPAAPLRPATAAPHRPPLVRIRRRPRLLFHPNSIHLFASRPAPFVCAARRISSQTAHTHTENTPKHSQMIAAQKNITEQPLGPNPNLPYFGFRIIAWRILALD